MLAVQYTRVFSSPAYRKYYKPFYGASDSQIWEIPAEGTPRKWLDDGLDKVQFEASPDGTMVAYVVNGKNGEYNSVWVARVDGSNPQQLTPDYPDEDFTHYVDLVGWSADAKKIAYRVDYYYGLPAGWLYIVDVPSGQIVEMNIENVKRAAWFPKSSHLVAIYDDVSNLRLFDVNTQAVITEEVSSCSIACPWRSILPDGTKKYEISHGILTVYALDGSQLYQVNLGDVPNNPRYFMWSPDAKWFVFRVEEENRLSNIYKLSEGNKTPQLVLEGSQVSPSSHEILKMGLSNFELFPTWSPDSQWFVVFNSLGKTGAGELYVINVETNEVRTVMTLSPFAPMRDGIGPVIWFGSQ